MTFTQAIRDGSDPNVRPQDDLFGHVNGRWLETVEIPADLAGYGAFAQLRLDAEAQVGDILSEAADRSASGGADAGSNTQKIGDFFASFLDEVRTEEHGAAPLAADLAAIADVQDLAGLAGLVGRLARAGVGGVVVSYTNTDDRQSDRYVINMLQGGIGLPDEAYYRDDAFAEIRDKYVAHVAAMLRLAGRDDPVAADEARRVVALETRLAAGHWDKVASRDRIKTYNLMSFAEVVTRAPHFDWPAWAAGLQAPDGAFDEIIVRQPSYLGALDTALTEVSLDDWKTWLSWKVIHAAAPYLSSDFVNEDFDFYTRTLTGAEEQRERWKRGVTLVDGALGEAIGEEYVARHFPPEAKAEMERLVGNLVEAYRRSISSLEWMGEETRHRALEKLDLFLPKIGYPDKWRDYSTMEVRRDDLLGNVRRATAFEADRDLAKIGSPVDRDEWQIYPQTVNAYYNPGTNEICFPAAILRPPFFDLHAEAALNYGGIGAVIGHEIGHGFDDQGSQYDGAGNLVDWWTADDRAGFTERADRLIAQYNEFSPRALPEHKVNGALTVGENIGDLGGLTIALLAYQISLGPSVAAPVVDGLTGVQRLFFNWALVWRGKRREALELQLLSVDPHSPPEFRTNIVRNLDEFHTAFDTAPGDGLWLDPADRVRIW